MLFPSRTGTLPLIRGNWYVTHAGLLKIAERSDCQGINVAPVQMYCNPASSIWVFRAVVFKSGSGRGFVGYGDAGPTNVAPNMRGAEMRIAETRAVNRALRKAYAIGLCSVEELGRELSTSKQPTPARGVSHNGHELRDRLLLLIREHELDPAQVKRYAVQFCGTSELREAGRDRVEALVRQLTEVAAQGREQLTQLLAAYAERSGDSASNLEAA